MHRLAGVLIPSLLFVLAWLPAGADVEIEFITGATLKARSIERVDELYEITADTGVLTLPLALVREIRLLEQPSVEEPVEIDIAAFDAATGGGSPPHVDDSSSPPAWLQLAAFTGDPGAFPRPTVDPRWEPDDTYGEATDETQFDPAAWARPRGFDWEPDDDYEQGGLPQFGVSEWPRSSVETRWSPRDRWRARLLSPDE